MHALDLTSVSGIQSTFGIEVHFAFWLLMRYKFIYMCTQIRQPVNASASVVNRREYRILYVIPHFLFYITLVDIDILLADVLF